MATKDILLIVFPLVSGVLASYFTYYLALKSKRDEAILRFKEEKYSNLILMLQGFIGVTANTKNKKAFFEEQYRSWIYASDEVVLTMKDMVDLLLKTQFDAKYQDQQRAAIGKVVLAMRKDMLRKTNLSEQDFQYTSVLDSPSKV